MINSFSQKISMLDEKMENRLVNLEGMIKSLGREGTEFLKRDL